MKIKIITASHRAPSNSKKVGEVLATSLNNMKGVDASVLCLFEQNLPLWNQDKWNPDSEQWKQAWSALSQELKSCDGFVFVVPEYNGMVPAILSNFFLLCENGELAHKAGLIVSVSAGISGSYPIAELRNFSYKNTKVCYIPEHLIIRHVDSFLDENNQEDAKLYMQERIDYTLPVFVEYVKALAPLRNMKVTETAKFRFGM